jgi:hypothetical protein
MHVDFTIYQEVRPDQMVRAGVKTEQEFAAFFAGVIQRGTGCEVVGMFRDGMVHLETDEENMEKVGEALSVRGFTYRFCSGRSLHGW